MGKPIAIIAALSLIARNTAAPVSPTHVTSNIMPANVGTPFHSGKLPSGSAGARVIGLTWGASLLVILALYAISL
jgi:hypothetical protein